MQAFTDQTGHTIYLDKAPVRIISLVPSQTELLFDLGLDEQVVGITKFCKHPPEWFYTKRRIGGTKKLHIDIIHELQPDLIIANKEENEKVQVEELSGNYPVWTSDVTNLATAYEMIRQLGLLTHTTEKAVKLISAIKTNFSQLRSSLNKPRTCYLIWNDPYMTVGGDTFIHSMLEEAGFENIFKNKGRYPVITLQDIIGETDINARCEWLLLASEPFPFKQKHADELKLAMSQAGLPDVKIDLVDGEMFSWYGSHLLYAPDYFRSLHNLDK